MIIVTQMFLPKGDPRNVSDDTAREMLRKEAAEKLANVIIERLRVREFTREEMGWTAKEFFVNTEDLDKPSNEPMKVTHEATLQKCCTCPRCKNVVDEFNTFGEQKVRVRVKFCKFCGAHLDWSGEQNYQE